MAYVSVGMGLQGDSQTGGNPLIDLLKGRKFPTLDQFNDMLSGDQMSCLCK